MSQPEHHGEVLVQSEDSLHTIELSFNSNEFDLEFPDIEFYWFKPPHNVRRMHLKLAKHGRFYQ